MDISPGPPLGYLLLTCVDKIQDGTVSARIEIERGAAHQILTQLDSMLIGKLKGQLSPITLQRNHFNSELVIDTDARDLRSADSNLGAVRVLLAEIRRQGFSVVFVMGDNERSVSMVFQTTPTNNADIRNGFIAVKARLESFVGRLGKEEELQGKLTPYVEALMANRYAPVDSGKLFKANTHFCDPEPSRRGWKATDLTSPVGIVALEILSTQSLSPTINSDGTIELKRGRGGS